MRIRWMLGCVAAVLVSAVAAAAVPNVFVAGQPASASQVNVNFAYLDHNAVGALITLGRSQSSDLTTSVVATTCPSGSIVLSASCGCSNANGTRNYGVLFSCLAVASGGVGGCFPELATYNANLPLPRADITLVCLSGTAVDGTPLFVFPAAKVAQDADELQAKENELRRMEVERATP